MKPALIWDLPTRLFHWTLAGSFAVAWLTSEQDTELPVHVFFGYLMLGLVVFRIFWGLVGSHFSRFSSFPFKPKEGYEYLKQVVTGKAERHVGHNPAGSLAIYALLILTVLVCAAGILTLGSEEQHGPAAGWLGFDLMRVLKGAHKLGAIAMLLIVVGHVIGVVAESILHKENLARSMLTGYKRAGADTPQSTPRLAIAGIMLMAILSFATSWFYYAIDNVVQTQNVAGDAEGSGKETPKVKFVGSQLVDNVQWREECGSCHAVFYPALLPARSWQKMMAEQDKHFGTDLGFDKPTSDALLSFMVANAADKHLTEAAVKIDRSVAPSQAPLRITETPYWLKKHRDITTAQWNNPLVKSKSNCVACHLDADAGTYEDGAMRIPDSPAASPK